jgi:hypothetical protein
MSSAETEVGLLFGYASLRFDIRSESASRRVFLLALPLGFLSLAFRMALISFS